MSQDDSIQDAIEKIRGFRSEVPKEEAPASRPAPTDALETRVVKGDRCAKCCAREAEWAVAQIASAFYQAASLGPGEGFAIESRGRPGEAAGGRAPEGRPRAIPWGGGTGRAVPPGMESVLPEGSLDDPLGVCTIRFGKLIGVVEKYADRLAEYYRSGGGCEDCCRRAALRQGTNRIQYQLSYRGEDAGKITRRK